MSEFTNQRVALGVLQTGPEAVIEKMEREIVGNAPPPVMWECDLFSHYACGPLIVLTWGCKVPFYRRWLMSLVLGTKWTRVKK